MELKESALVVREGRWGLCSERADQGPRSQEKAGWPLEGSGRVGGGAAQRPTLPVTLHVAASPSGAHSLQTTSPPGSGTAPHKRLQVPDGTRVGGHPWSLDRSRLSFPWCTWKHHPGGTPSRSSVSSDQVDPRERAVSLLYFPE